MTLLTKFNNALKGLPAISEDLENLIMMQGWSEKKSQQAISIIEQIKGDVIHTELCEGYSYVSLYLLRITLSPSECGIDDKTFKPENIRQGDKYIEDLLADINRISADVKFSFVKHCNENNENNENKVCTFYIRWKF